MIGARQVEKSTMLKHLAEAESRTVVTMDDDMARELAANDPGLFFQTYKPPKLYFCDTGLCAYLTRWLTPDSPKPFPIDAKNSLIPSNLI